MARLLTLLTFALLLGSSAAAQQPAQQDRLRPGDVIRLKIWQEPDLSGDFVIDATGEVVLPKVGTMQVLGESPEALEDRIVAAYSQYLQHQSIDVTLLRRVQVLGAVRNPGLYPVDATMTISDALAMAGGATTTGRPDRVELVRDGRRIQGEIGPNTRLSASSIQSGDQLFVPERSWISRNTGLVAAGLSTGASLIIAFLAR